MSVADPKCFVRLKEPIPGIDHIKFIDHEEGSEEAERLRMVLPCCGAVTLIETIIVLAIIAGLLALLFPAVQRVEKKRERPFAATI